jgi:CRISPR/Cas system-associated endonuclease Cas3-HD
MVDPSGPKAMEIFTFNKIEKKIHLICIFMHSKNVVVMSLLEKVNASLKNQLHVVYRYKYRFSRLRSYTAALCTLVLSAILPS